MSEVAVIAIGVIATIVGVSVFVWSTIDTRKRYYDEYLKRRRNAGD